MFNKLFNGVKVGKIQDQRVKISPYGLAFIGDDGRYLAYDEVKKSFMDVTDLVFDFDASIFAMPVAKNTVKAGDIIYSNTDEYFRVIGENSRGSLIVQSFSDQQERILLPVKNLFGFDFYSKVFSPFDGMLRGLSKDSSFESLMPLMLMSEGGNDSLMTMMMMSQMQGDKNIMNPFMMMMLMDSGKGGNGFGKGGRKDMFEMMMLMQMMQGGKTNFPDFTNLFDNTKNEE